MNLFQCQYSKETALAGSHAARPEHTLLRRRCSVPSMTPVLRKLCLFQLTIVLGKSYIKHSCFNYPKGDKQAINTVMVCHKSHLGIAQILQLITTVTGEEPMKKYDTYIMFEHTMIKLYLHSHIITTHSILESDSAPCSQQKSLRTQNPIPYAIYGYSLMSRPAYMCEKTPVTLTTEENAAHIFLLQGNGLHPRSYTLVLIV